MDIGCVLSEHCALFVIHFAYDKLYCVHVFLYLINKIVEQLWLKIPAICFLFQGYYYTVTIPLPA